MDNEVSEVNVTPAVRPISVSSAGIIIIAIWIAVRIDSFSKSLRINMCIGKLRRFQQRSSGASDHLELRINIVTFERDCTSMRSVNDSRVVRESVALNQETASTDKVIFLGVLKVQI